MMTLFLFLLIFLSLASLYVAVSCLRAGGNHAEKRGKFYLVLASIFTSVLMLEVYFRLLGGYSDAIGFTLAARTWKERYWNPINAEGYRDTEWCRDCWERGKLMVVTGDSFVAGHGIDRIEQRFADRTAVKLGPEWHKVILAQPAWGPRRQVAALREFPARADVVVASYYVNDLEDAYPFCGRSIDYTLPLKPRFGAWYVDNSYFFNWLYWRVVRASATPLTHRYEKGLQSALTDETCRGPHLAQLSELASVAREKGRKVLFVLFPLLPQPEKSHEQLKAVEEHLKPLADDVLNLEREIMDRDPSSLIVNTLDYHPNAIFNELVAEKLAERIRKQQ